MCYFKIKAPLDLRGEKCQVAPTKQDLKLSDKHPHPFYNIH